jgi:hypothetical protein
MRTWHAVLAVGVIAVLAALAGLDARATYGARLSGDEPQYLLTATSIGEDFDLDITDEIDARRFAAYHEVDLDPQTAVLGTSNRQVSPHDPLLPAILAVPMRAGGWQSAKATLALIAGLTAALATWLAIRRLGARPLPAGVGMAAAFVGIPLAAYGSQVYPEMPGALAVLAAVAALTAPVGSAGSAGWTAAAVAAIAALPWLSVKYVPVAAVLGLFLVWGVRRSTRTLVSVLAALAVLGVVYLVAHRVWYGGWTVYATGDHFSEAGEFAVVGTNVDPVGRSRRLVNLLVDRDFGIAAWSPVWLLAPFGAGLLIARRWAGRWMVPATIAAGWLNATFVALTMHGWWVPGRQTVIVLPLLALGLVAVADFGTTWCAVVGGLGIVGAFNWLWLAVEASTDRRTLIVDFFDTAAWPYRAVRPILPAGLLGFDGRDGLLLAGWSVFVVATAWVGWRAAHERSRFPVPQQPASGC